MVSFWGKMAARRTSISLHWKESTSECFRSGKRWNTKNGLATNGCGRSASGLCKTFEAKLRVGVEFFLRPRSHGLNRFSPRFQRIDLIPVHESGTQEHEMKTKGSITQLIRNQRPGYILGLDGCRVAFDKSSFQELDPGELTIGD